MISIRYQKSTCVRNLWIFQLAIISDLSSDSILRIIRSSECAFDTRFNCVKTERFCVKLTRRGRRVILLRLMWMREKNATEARLVFWISDDGKARCGRRARNKRENSRSLKLSFKWLKNRIILVYPCIRLHRSPITSGSILTREVRTQTWWQCAT